MPIPSRPVDKIKGVILQNITGTFGTSNHDYASVYIWLHVYLQSIGLLYDKNVNVTPALNLDLVDRIYEKEGVVPCWPAIYSEIERPASTSRCV